MSSGEDARSEDSSDVTELVRAVEKRFGLRLHVGFHTVLAERAFLLLGHHGATTLSDVTRRLRDADDEDPIVIAMGQAASIGETYFFRSPKQLKVLERMIQQLAEAKRAVNHRVMRLWSAACATGEEPYTLGMICQRVIPDFRVQIFASDMNAAALQIAATGEYRKRSFRGVDPSTLPFLQSRGDHWVVDKELRQRVVFTELNLTQDAIPDSSRGLANFDLILCRNVLIYIDEDKIPEVMRKLAAAATARSLIALTPAETPSGRHLPGFTTGPEGIFLRVKEGIRAGKPKTSPTPSAKRASETLAPPASKGGHSKAHAREKSDLRAQAESVEALRLAREAADKGQLGEALRLAEHAAGLAPSEAQPCYLLAVVSAAAGEAERAQRCFERVLFLDRSFVAAELGLGELLSKSGRREEAVKHLNRAQRLLSKRAPEELVEGLDLSVALTGRLLEGLLTQGDHA
ncbi:MAG: CheR family methyltransferase [Myxococcaceae bacterium]